MCFGTNVKVQKRIRKITARLPTSLRTTKWSDLSYAIKVRQFFCFSQFHFVVPLALAPTTAVWVMLSVLNKKSIKELAPSLMAAYGKSVGLLGVRDIYGEMKKNLGVKLTIPRTYQVFTTLGYFLSTISELAITNTGVGRVFFMFNMIFLLAHSYMLYLTSVYNSRLEDTSRTFERSFASFEARRQAVNVPALVGWFSLNILTLYIWMNEGLHSLKTSLGKEILSALGFLLISIGSMRSGFKASMTSSADITPFAGALTVGLAAALSAFSLIPLLKASPIARIYMAGYASVIYSALLNAFYAFRTERQKRKKLMAAKQRRAKL